jgi:predicted aspartyl protease
MATKGGIVFFSIKKVETKIDGQFDIVFLLPPRWMDEWMDR